MRRKQAETLWNVTRNHPVVTTLHGARTVVERGLGLLARPRLASGEALWLEPGGSVHTWGMRYSLDVLFLGPDLHVLRVTRDLKPWRIGWAPRGTRSVVELPAGAAAGVREGDRLAVRSR